MAPLGESYLSAEVQSVYSKALADRAFDNKYIEFFQHFLSFILVKSIGHSIVKIKEISLLKTKNESTKCPFDRAV